MRGVDNPLVEGIGPQVHGVLADAAEVAAPPESRQMSSCWVLWIKEP